MKPPIPDSLRLVGGHVPGCSGRGQVALRWSKELDYRAFSNEPGTIAERDGIIAEMQSIRYRQRTPRVDHARARAKLERAGLDTLELPDRDPPTPARRWIVRVYYRSEGGELLCFDAGPLTVQAADKLASEFQTRQIFNPAKGKRRLKNEPMYIDDPNAPGPSAEKFDRAEIGADAIAQGRYRKPNHGARLVVLPSQQHRQREPEVEPCPECGSPELCRPECHVAPWNQELTK